jgi:hypothetical protein
MLEMLVQCTNLCIIMMMTMMIILHHTIILYYHDDDDKKLLTTCKDEGRTIAPPTKPGAGGMLSIAKHSETRQS